MKDTTLLKIALGASKVLPSGLSGIHGCNAKTTYPKINNVVLNKRREAVYCFQFCGPLLMCCSNQANTDHGRYFPSIIQARYRLKGKAISVATINKEKGSNQV